MGKLGTGIRKASFVTATHKQELIHGNLSCLERTDNHFSTLKLPEKYLQHPALLEEGLLQCDFSTKSDAIICIGKRVWIWERNVSRTDK